MNSYETFTYDLQHTDIPVLHSSAQCKHRVLFQGLAKSNGWLGRIASESQKKLCCWHAMTDNDVTTLRLIPLNRVIWFFYCLTLGLNLQPPDRLYTFNQCLYPLGHCKRIKWWNLGIFPIRDSFQMVFNSCLTYWVKSIENILWQIWWFFIWIKFCFFIFFPFACPIFPPTWSGI